MKILFLDVDGVLNGHEWIHDRPAVPRSLGLLATGACPAKPLILRLAAFARDVPPVCPPAASGETRGLFGDLARCNISGGFTPSKV